MALVFLSKQRILARLQEMDTERSAHINDWKKITEYIRPARGKYLDDSSERNLRPTSMVNSTPYEASRMLAAGMQSGASSPAYEWFKLTWDDPGLERWGPARTALEQRQRILYNVLRNSNFYDAMTTLYGDAGDFGNGHGIVDESEDYVVNFSIMSPGEYFIDTDAHNDVNTIYRKFFLTTLQIVSRFGLDVVSTTVRSDYDRGNYQTKHSVIEAIERNQEFRPDRADWWGKPFIKVCFEEKNTREDTKEFLSVSGYNEFPGFGIRWDLASGNKWGWGPGIAALGDSLALQTLEFRDAQAIEKAVKPPLQAPSNLRNRPVSHAPGGVTYYDPFMATGLKVEPIYQIMPGILQALDAKRQAIELRIKRLYYNDLFLMLATTDRREITAREVEEKHGEKLLALGPVLTRTHRSCLGNAIMRAYRIAERQGLFPPPPRELTENSIKIEYTSSLAFAQRAAGAASIERFFGFVGNVGQYFPDMVSKIDGMASLDEYADAIGVPATIMRSTKDAEARLQQQQTAQSGPEAAQTAKVSAEAAKLLSETDTTRPSALSFLRERVGL